jgi:rare lipoprotein A
VSRAHLRRLSALGLLLLLSACGSTSRTGGYAQSHYAPGEPRYTVAPYQVNGIWYYPKVDYAYDETGTASWYGPQFDHRPTSDGEIFDMNEVSAAHKTLPLPSVVEVTNLQNGRALEMRVNDRGPFVGDRLIDVSRRAAQLLGFEEAGTAPVRVRILKDQSIEVAEAAMRGETGPVVAAATPAPAPIVAAAAPAPVVVRPPQPQPTRLAAAPTPPPAPALPPVRVAAAPKPTPSLSLITGAQAAEPSAIPPAPRRLPAATPAMSPRTFANRIEAALIPAAAAATYEPVRLPPARPRPVVATRSGGRIFIQAGAFALLDNAERVQARIARLGAVEVTAVSGRGAALYRVRLGPLASIEKANALLARVIDSGCAGARIVSE